jgi:hypothetical protein
LPDVFHYHARGDGKSVALALPFSLDEIVVGWGAVRDRALRAVPPEFTRAEWAYLALFLDPAALRAVPERAFGAGQACPGEIAGVARPRGQVAVWLPSNVSLLGPLTLVLLSLTGNPLTFKAASEGADLTSAFRAFAISALPASPLRAYLEREVSVVAMPREDTRVAALARSAMVRVVFGSDAAAAAVHALPHPVESVGISFVDRHSEAWIHPARVDDALLLTLARVFSVYGQAGCTAPRRVVLLDASPDEAGRLRDRLAELWPSVAPRPPMHIATQNVMARQWAAAEGWDAVLSRDHAAVLAVGGLDHPPLDAPWFLGVCAASSAAALRQLPAHTQTVGLAWQGDAAAKALEILTRSRARRVVPIERMHHFLEIWDGSSFWRAAFEELEVGS